MMPVTASLADGANYPDARFVLTCAFTTAPTENTTIALYARPLNIDGTADSDAPETTRPTQYIGVFVVNNIGSSTSQSLVCMAQNVPWEADYYLHNNGTGQTIRPAGSCWSLHARLARLLKWLTW
jgi:hypothetical protein